MPNQETVMKMHDDSPEAAERNKRASQLIFKLNHTMPETPEYMELLRELFGENLGSGSVIMPPIQMVAPEKFFMGKNVFINGNLLAMSMGGVTVEDDVQMAANVQILTNNHDPYDRELLTCLPVVIKKGAWIGAGATILPGVTVGRHAIVGAAAVVTKDVPDYGIAVGNPAKVVKILDASRFAD